MSARAFAPAGLENTELAWPRTVDEACALLEEAQRTKRRAVMLAGGTDWIVDRHLAEADRAPVVDLVLDVTRIEELTAVRFYRRSGEARLVLGGGVTYWTLRTDRRIAEAIPMLEQMARDVGAVQIQTRGTLAGNIASASPAADGVPVLMALDAEVRLKSTAGERVVPLDRFFVGYRKTVLLEGEVIVEIDCRIPASIPGAARVSWRKVGTRLAQAISKVALASVVETDGEIVSRARFGMASVAAVTHPLPTVRSVLEGRKLSTVTRAELDAALTTDVTPIDDVRSTAAYRAHVAKGLLWRAVMGDLDAT